MSDTEEAILVEKMADELEAEPFQKDFADLVDFSEVPQLSQKDEQPVSSTSDQLLDFMTPDTPEATEQQEVEEVSSSLIPPQAQADETVEQQQVTSTAVEETPAVSQTEQTSEEPVQAQEPRQELTSCMAKWLKKNNVDQRVIDLIYWKCWKKTAAIFAAKLFILWSLTCCTFVSVMSCLSMCILAVAFLYRIGMTVFNAVQKTTSEHPFRHCLEEDLELSEESVQRWANETRLCINSKIKTMKRLFLIEDVVESLKFGIVLWMVSYVGSCFSLISIAFLTCIFIFTVPCLYERHQKQVDCCLASLKNKAMDAFTKVQDKLPEKLKFGKPKED
eukprot:gene20060-22029_t